jgi:hypothetical protein
LYNFVSTRKWNTIPSYCSTKLSNIFIIY